MELESSEQVDQELMFVPQLYDRLELAFLKKYLKSGDTFLDAGSNIGYYSLLAAKRVSPGGIVISVEADPYNFAKLGKNLALNGCTNVRALKAGLSDRDETLRLSVSTRGNRGGNSFLWSGLSSVEVQCTTLLALLTREGVDHVKAAKFDLEGFDFRVLELFFRTAPRVLYPHVLVVEENEGYVSAGTISGLLDHYGYRIEATYGENLAAVLVEPIAV